MERKLDKYLLAILLFNGLIWARSSFGKFQSGNFADNLDKTLTVFASKNPYPWYKNFLNNIALPNSQLFGNLTMYGELLTAIAIVGGSIYFLWKGFNRLVALGMLAGLLGGMFLNMIFWLASGWTSPSTDGINLLMFFVQLTGSMYIFKLLSR